ncbi:MAG TPA: nuclear transport factor 2 family protein [Polyangiaceae bacterium]|nr:nuclear transport factor 2 family protein [Polyangiaceae bacterium]
MTESTTQIATAYYQAIARKDLVEVTKYLHPDVHFLGLVETQGRDAFLGAAQKMMSHSSQLEIRAVLGDKLRATVIYDLIFPAPIGVVRTAALLSLESGLIKNIELFFDASPFKR